MGEHKEECGYKIVQEHGLQYVKDLLDHRKGATLVGIEIVLKRIVESHKLVDDFGGVGKSRLKVQGNRLSYKKTAALWKAILDVESCQ